MAAPSSVEGGWLFGMRDDEGGHHDQHQFKESHVANSSSKLTSNASPSTQKKKRTQPDPGAEVIALSPKTLTTTSRFICDVCNKGFQREQNLQLHRRGHSLPWKLKLKSTNTNEVRKKVYVCPEPTCVHHCPSRALGDLTGIKKHFFRKHCEKKWECEKCSKRYAVQSDLKAHSKTCGTKEYRCDCGTLFSRRDSFMTHQAFCNAIAQGSFVNTTNLSALKSQVLGHMSMVNGNDFGSLMPSGPFHTTSTVALSCSPTYHDQEEEQKLALDAMMQQKDQTDPSENTDHQSFFYSTAKEDYSDSTTNNVDYYNNNNNNNKIRNDFSSTNLYTNHQLESCVGGSSAGLYVSENVMMSDHISQCLYTSSVSFQNCNYNGASSSSAYLSATALLQKAAQVGSSYNNNTGPATTILRALGSTSKKLEDLDNNASLGTSVTCFSTLQNTNHIVHGGWMRCYNGGVESITPSSGEYTVPNGVVVPTTGGGGGGGVSDVLTRDFLGVGLIVKPMSDGITRNDHMTLQNDQHQFHQMSSRRVVLGRNADFSSP